MPKKKTSKKKTRKRTQTATDIRTFTIRIPTEDVEFLDESARIMNTSRQKILATVIRGMRLADEESNKQGTFFHMYTNSISSIVEEAITRKHGR